MLANCFPTNPAPRLIVKKSIHVHVHLNCTQMSSKTNYSHVLLCGFARATRMLNRSRQTELSSFAYFLQIACSCLQLIVCMSPRIGLIGHLIRDLIWRFPFEGAAALLSLGQFKDSSRDCLVVAIFDPLFIWVWLLIGHLSRDLIGRFPFEGAAVIRSWIEKRQIMTTWEFRSA